jgi:beta-1,3-galactosyltransferase 1
VVIQNSLLQESVLLEAQKYGDIVVEDFIDSYHNLTLKSLFMFKWTMNWCSSVPFVLKTDDDMLINVRGLLQELENSKYKLSQPLIIGRIQAGSTPYRQKSSKWYLPHWLYEGTIFPMFASGTGYVMTQEAVCEVFSNALDTPLLPLEDVFLTGVVATKNLGIPLINEPRFHNDRPLFFEHPCLYYHLLTVHQVTPTKLRRLWTSLSMLKQTKCDSFYARFLEYFFGTGQYEVLTDVVW